MEETFITKIDINKVRHLKDLEIKLSDTERKNLIFTGKNGSGKTSVLIEIGNFFNLKDMRIRKLLNLKYQIKSSTHENTKQKLIVDRQLILSELPIDIDFSSYIPLDEIIFLQYNINRKLNVIKSKGTKDINISQNAQDFERFLAKKRTEQAFLSFEKANKRKVDDISEWFDHLEKNLQFLFEDESLKLLTKRNEDVVEFYLNSDNREEFDFNTLSSGYSSILFILFDIIQQMDNDVNLDYKKQGIVLIDELEAHLHISLQKKILPFLTKFFPNIQFIIATHSPFILQSDPNAIIFDLETHERHDDFSNYSTETLVETYFDNDKFSDALKLKMALYEEMIKSINGKFKNKEEILKLRSEFFEISDLEINYWIKDLDLKYMNKIKPLLK